MMRSVQQSRLVETAPGASAFGFSTAYRNYVVALIWVVLLLRFVDLQIISVLLESIKAEFEATDTQLGLLSGLAFALFYATLGIPIAWLADHFNRRNIIAIAVGLWSAMTALCGAATGFISLFLARIGVGVGEAGGSPPAYSLISDYVRPEKRSTVFAILNTSIPLGIFTGFLIGGWVNEYFGWRAAFMVVGIPGVIVALLVGFTLREPPRGFSENRTIAAEPHPIKDTLKHLWGLHAYRHIVLASSIFTIGAYGAGIWLPSFFIRVHGMGAGEVGTWMALIYGGGGTLGSVVGGMLTDRLASKTGDKRWYTWVPAIACACILPFSIAVYLSPSPLYALLAQTFTTVLMYTWNGPAHGMVQNICGVKRRAVATAINQLATTLIGLGLGPLMVGAASDYFNADFGVDSLRYSILAVAVVSFTWAAVHFLLAAKSLRANLAQANAE